MRRTAFLLGIVFPVLLLAMAGCTMYKISGRGALPIMLNSPPSKVDVIKHITESKMIAFDYTGAFDVSELLSKPLQESQADAIINVTIMAQSDVGTFFVNLFTLGIANAHTMVVEGDLVKAPQGLGYLSIPGSEVVAEATTLKGLQMKLSDERMVPGVATMIARTPSGYALVRYDTDQLGISR
ncbi:MAG: hypothetical protein M1470_15100 [Bacteroidetes bacterium]|nr:hypothetical protein [Bacteroidota bacterium]MCL5738693.1 hypothetical protein [Bacteroidota bacterium]